MSISRILSEGADADQSPEDLYHGADGGCSSPADLLARIIEGDSTLKGLTPEDYHLLPSERINEATNRAWNRAIGAWAAFQDARAHWSSLEPGTSDTRERWLLPLFQEFGYGRLFATRTIEMQRKNYPISHVWRNIPIHLVGAGIDLDRRTAGVAGAAHSSPHGLVQELLINAGECLWGFVSNGLRLRILRDSSRLSRQAYVEFDLEAMMEGEVYADFVLLWLLCHESRVEAEQPADCWLEKWVHVAREQGTRVREDLRSGVQQAIEALGHGFLAHPANGALRSVYAQVRSTLRCTIMSYCAWCIACSSSSLPRIATHCSIPTPRRRRSSATRITTRHGGYATWPAVSAAAGTETSTRCCALC